MKDLDSFLQKRLVDISKYLSGIDGISILSALTFNNLDINGTLAVDFENGKQRIEFDISIAPEYPFRRNGIETIRFCNKNLIEYGHVMRDGSICIHTSHASDLQKKLQIDINSLKRWIWVYYVNEGRDSKYEHILVEPTEVNGTNYSFLFTEVEHKFKIGEYGFFQYSKIRNGLFFATNILNHTVLSFIGKDRKLLANCKWSNDFFLHGKELVEEGVFLFVEFSPALYNKFAYSDWSEFSKLINQNALLFLYNVQKKYSNNTGQTIPLLIGYKINDVEIHWQVILLQTGRFPIEARKIGKDWYGFFLKESIVWGITKNCSYRYFFGRGKLHNRITNGKVLIIGIGAIGSILATTLTRGGCTNIDILEFDVKYPENICRSEYHFVAGITNKSLELAGLLNSISPFINVRVLEEADFNIYTKSLYKIQDEREVIKLFLSQYDMIFDCSTDNDLLYVLSQLDINVITMSITNKAKALICGTEPKSYNWVMHQAEFVLENDSEDLYAPTGCTEPTFLASYNDISALVQYAIKHINNKYIDEKPLKNFTLESKLESGFVVKINEF